MILAEDGIQRVRTAVEAAFPRFADWEFVNEINESYHGFSIWGGYTFEPEEWSSPHFFVTFDTFEETWRGYLSVGKPSYLWSSADVGDALLIDSGPCAALEDVVAGLKSRIAALMVAFLGSGGHDAKPLP